jgi:hypothetical protein
VNSKTTWLGLRTVRYRGEGVTFPVRGIDAWITELPLLLALGAFAIGTEGFMIAGLPTLARDLNVRPARRKEDVKVLEDNATKLVAALG